jgi:pimeloyl-ACP methyl ester carboxylesterase
MLNKPSCRIVLTLTALVTSLALPSPAAEQVGPLALNGEIQGAPFKVRVPANWNGTLLVHIHGYRDKADHAGEVDDRTVDAAPGGLAGESFFLSQGYALAGTALRGNGWAVDEGIKDVRNLTTYFQENVARPDRTILWGFSMGSVIALKSTERFGGLYDGTIAGCAVGAGASRTFDQSLALNLAYDVAFGLPASIGTPGDVRDDVNFDTELAPLMAGQLSNPANFGKFEFIRLVAGIPASPAFYPSGLFTDFFFTTEARAELERRARGAFAQNLNHTYGLTNSEKLYLASLGVNADALLAAMNSRRDISGEPSARNYVEHYADFNGHLQHPVLTIHTLVDTLVTVTHESAYRETVAATGREDLLVQAFTSGVGHCNFTAPQLLAAVTAMNAWLATGTAPTAAQFPAVLGFVPGFTPPPFPFPEP